MIESSPRVSLAVGVLILLAGCYSNNGGLLDGNPADFTPSGASSDGDAGGYPIGPARPDGGVVARRYESIGGWGTAEAIYDGPSTAGDARLAVDGSGDVAAVFPVTSNVWASHFESGDGWSAWSQAPTGIPRNIYGNQLTSGTWGTADKIEAASTGFGLAPQLALGSNGDGLFIWKRENVGVSQVWTNAWDASADELSEPILLDDAVDAYAPGIAMSPSGIGVAVWLQSSVLSSGELDVTTSPYTPGSGWSEPETLTTGDVRDEPRVAMAPNGNAVVVCREGPDIWAATFG